MKQPTKRDLPLRPILVMLISGVSERILRVVYSALSSDIVYQETPWPDVLLILANLCGSILLGAACGAVAVALLRRRCVCGTFLLSAGLLLAVALSGWIVDLLAHNITGYEWLGFASVMIAVGVKLAVLLVTTVFGALVSRRRPIRPIPWIVASAGLYCLVLLVSVAVSIVSFLTEYHYPTAAEIGSMIRDVVECLLYSGVAVSGAGVVTFLLGASSGEARK